MTDQSDAAATCRYVAFADVLGFKDLMNANSLPDLMRIYDDVFVTAATNAASGVLGDVSLATINVTVVSDSVIIWTDDDRPPEFIAILLAVHRLIAHALTRGIPVRAAIAWGEAEYFRRKYNSPRVRAEALVGPAFVEAYQAEGVQEWAGGIVLDEALAHYADSSVGTLGAPTVDKLHEDSRWLVEYDVPTKKGPKRHEAINWTTVAGAPSTADEVRRAFVAWGKTVSDNKVHEMIENTIEFGGSVGTW